MLTRWPDVIPASSPDPVKPTATSLSSAPVAVRRAESPLFGADDDSSRAAPDGVGGNGMDLDDVDLDAQDDDWIIDDLGGGMRDKPEADGYTREMGKILDFRPSFFFITESFSSFSECDQSPTFISARSNSICQQTTLFG